MAFFCCAVVGGKGEVSFASNDDSVRVRVKVDEIYFRAVSQLSTRDVVR